MKDSGTRRSVVARIEHVRGGNFGDHKTFGQFGELRFKSGGGIQVYYTLRHRQVVLLLAGGNKSGQERDFKKVRAMIEQLED